MKNNKILIILFYYNRPNLVINALESIKRQNPKYDNWELAFIDDGSEKSFDVLSYFDNDKRVRVYTVTPDIKKSYNYKTIGLLGNKAMRESDADLAIMLCDDDALCEDYLYNINNWFNEIENQTYDYAYSHVIIFDPLQEQWSFEIPIRDCMYNQHYGEIYPPENLDSSQVCWKLQKSKEKDCWFAEDRIANLDSHLYDQLFLAFGYCPFSGLYGQYKGLHNMQLGYTQHERIPLKERE